MRRPDDDQTAILDDAVAEPILERPVKDHEFCLLVPDVAGAAEEEGCALRGFPTHDAVGDADDERTGFQRQGEIEAGDFRAIAREFGLL